MRISLHMTSHPRLFKLLTATQLSPFLAGFVFDLETLQLQDLHTNDQPRTLLTVINTLHPPLTATINLSKCLHTHTRPRTAPTVQIHITWDTAKATPHTWVRMATTRDVKG
mmetsp:Transcript_29261/g.57461  ORF Transcript_29261/g.57461 Transcript_29261/m.57461 type:complete len:111 (-) Transcript_29261:51-383(-)